MRRSEKLSLNPDPFLSRSRLQVLMESKRFCCSMAILAAGVVACVTAVVASYSAATIFSIISFTTALSYLLLIFSLATELHFSNTQPAKNFVLVVTVYVAYTVLLVLQFAAAWYLGGGFGPATDKFAYKQATADSTDCLYFATTIFSTVGFGDYVPKIAAAKLYACFEGLISITHNATFFSMLLIRLAALNSPPAATPSEAS